MEDVEQVTLEVGFAKPTLPVCKVCENPVPKRKEYQPSVCEACQKFFRRHCERPNDLKCNGVDGAYDRCPTNCKNRRICQRCRFQKCVMSGMSSKFFALSPSSHQSSPPPLVSNNNSSSEPSPTTQSPDPPPASSEILPMEVTEERTSHSCMENEPPAVENKPSLSLITAEDRTLVPFVHQPVIYNGPAIEDLLHTSVRAFTALHDLQFLKLRRTTQPVISIDNILQMAMEQMFAETEMAFSYGKQFEMDAMLGLTESELHGLKGASSALVTLVFNNLLGNRGATLFGLSDTLAPHFLNVYPEYQSTMNICVELRTTLETWNPTLIETAILLSLLFFTSNASAINSERVVRIRARLLLTFNLHCATSADSAAVMTRRRNFYKCYQLTLAAFNNLLGATAHVAQREPFFASVIQVLNNNIN